MVEILALVLHREEQPRTRPGGTRALIRHRLQTTLLDVLGRLLEPPLPAPIDAPRALKLAIEPHAYPNGYLAPMYRLRCRHADERLGGDIDDVPGSTRQSLLCSAA